MRIGMLKPAAAGLALALAGSVIAQGPGTSASSAVGNPGSAATGAHTEYLQAMTANQPRSLDDSRHRSNTAMPSADVWGLPAVAEVEEWPHQAGAGTTTGRLYPQVHRVRHTSAEVHTAQNPAAPVGEPVPYVPEDYHSHLREMQAWEKSLVPQPTTEARSTQSAPQHSAGTLKQPVVRPRLESSVAEYPANAGSQVPPQWAPRPSSQTGTSHRTPEPHASAPIETVANVVPPAPAPTGDPDGESTVGGAPLADLPDFSRDLDDDTELAAMPYQAPVYTRRGKRKLLTNPAEPRDPASSCRDCWVSQLFPDGLLYKSYLAGEKEPRMGLSQLVVSGGNTIWEAALGGRVGLWRLGTPGAVRPEGWQIDLEGAALARVDKDENSDLDAADFRFGVPVTYRRGATAYKFGYYHLSSHVGDEYLLKHPTFRRRNYVRDAVVLGISQDFTLDLRGYAEVAYAPAASGGAEPLEFQFGAEYSPARSNGGKGDPFAAVNIHLREEFNFGGSVNVMTGWQWRGPLTDRLFRVGVQYYNGKSMQYSFFNEHEELIGAGMWFDY